MNDSNRAYLEEILAFASAGAEPLSTAILDAASKAADRIGQGEGAIFPGALLVCVVEMFRGSFDEPDRDVVGSIVGEWVKEAISAPSPGGG